MINTWTRNRQNGTTKRYPAYNYNFEYCQTLVRHMGCVNALTFSSDDKFLASGGDDRRILLWDLLHSDEANQLRCGHRSNIFSLHTDFRSEFLLSGGNDCSVICHSLETGSPIDVMMYHSAVHSVEFLCDTSKILMVATEGGKLELRDMRCSDCTLTGTVIGQSKSVYRSLSCHPYDNNLIVVTGKENGITLYDLRRTGGPIMRLFHKIDMSGVKWNLDGQRIAALGHRGAFVGSVYDCNKCDFFTHQDYENKITIKNIAWIGRDFIAAGSDNSNINVWDTRNNNKMVFNGHRSIVNQVVYNKTFNLLGSSGVEKIVKLWSQFPQVAFPKSRLEKTSNSNNENSRNILENNRLEVYINRVNALQGQVELEEENEDEDEEIIAFFDALREYTPPFGEAGSLYAENPEATGVRYFLEDSDSEENESDDTLHVNDVENSPSDLGDSDTRESSNDTSGDDSSSSSGRLETLSRSEATHVAQMEMFDIARRVHLQRQRMIQHLGGSGPNTALMTSESEEEEVAERRKRTRQQNARKRKRKK